MLRNTKTSPSRQGTRRLALALMASAGLAAIACGRSNVLYAGDAYGSGQIGSGGSGAVHTGGTGAVGVGGSGGSFGGSGGSVSTGGNFTTGGSVSLGGSGGSGGGLPVAGASGGPYACAGVEATCDAFHDFPLDTTVTWGNGAFTGGIAVFGNIVRDPDESFLRVAGTVSGYGHGFNLWFTRCSDISAYSGVLMTLSGTASPDGYVTFQMLTNSDFPWQLRPQDGKGACTSMDPMNPWSDCVAPAIEFAVTGSPLAVSWSAISGGLPVAWDPQASPGEIVGLQWLFPWNGVEYDVDLRLDELYLLSAGSPISCVSSMGGVGGMSGMGGIAGLAGSGGAGTAGEAGASQGGVGNEGGSGDAGAPASGGAPDAGFGGI